MEGEGSGDRKSGQENSWRIATVSSHMHSPKQLRIDNGNIQIGDTFFFTIFINGIVHKRIKAEEVDGQRKKS